MKPITYPLEPHNISVVRESEIICQNLAAKNKPFAKKSKALRPLCPKYRISVTSLESHYILATEDCRGAKRYVVRRSLSVLNKLFYDGGERGTLTFLWISQTFIKICFSCFVCFAAYLPYCFSPSRDHKPASSCYWRFDSGSTCTSSIESRSCQRWFILNQVCW